MTLFPKQDRLWWSWVGGEELLFICHVSLIEEFKHPFILFPFPPPITLINMLERTKIYRKTNQNDTFAFLSARNMG